MSAPCRLMQIKKRQIESYVLEIGLAASNFAHDMPIWSRRLSTHYIYGGLSDLSLDINYSQEYRFQLLCHFVSLTTHQIRLTAIKKSEAGLREERDALQLENESLKSQLNQINTKYNVC